VPVMLFLRASSVKPGSGLDRSTALRVTSLALKVRP
jgi:hypothetical protein